jgi:hypothetical protein
MADLTKSRPPLRVVGAAAEAVEGVEVSDAVAANWKQALGEALENGATGGTILYRTAGGDWGMAHTPDLGATDSWGLIDVAHEWADMKKLEDMSEC